MATDDTQPVAAPKPARRKKDIVSLVILAGFIVIGITVGILAYNLVQSIVLPLASVKLPGAPVDPANPNPIAPGGEPTLVPTIDLSIMPTPQPWDGASRINMLLMGLDYRDWEAKDIPRTDSMILLTIDPLTKTAGMLSIPRDMWVTIPGFNNAKINTAYFLGETYKIPGGGPALAAKTVENFLGVPIQFYAQIDFQAFVDFIDATGGIDVKVKDGGLVIDPVGSGNTIVLQEGTQTFDGKTALAYARARHSEKGDFDRARRQQQVIMAIRDNILNYYSLPKLVANAPTLYQKLSSGIRTNMTLDQVIQIAWLVKDVDAKKIVRGVIQPTDVTFGKSPDGLDIMKPIPDKIRILRDSIFTTSGPVGPAAAGTDPKGLMVAEKPRISIRNGTQIADLAVRTQTYFQSMGLNVVEAISADRIYDVSQISINTGKPYTLKYLAELFQVPTSRIENKGYAPDQPADIIIILGNDWAANNPM